MNGVKVDIEKLIGVKKNRLTAIGACEKLADSKTRVLVKCDCGNEVNMLSYSFLSGRTKSCGCFRKESSAKKVSTHCLSHHPLYKVWGNMVQRCYDTNSNRFYCYGGRGIKICDEWRNNFKSFYEWAIGNNWEKGKQIDRIDNNGNYEALNCRVVTCKENMNNKSNNRILSINGINYTMTQLSELCGISVSTLWARLDLGWSVENAINIQINNYKIKTNGNRQANTRPSVNI